MRAAEQGEQRVPDNTTDCLIARRCVLKSSLSPLFLYRACGVWRQRLSSLLCKPHVQKAQQRTLRRGSRERGRCASLSSRLVSREAHVLYASHTHTHAHTSTHTVTHAHSSLSFSLSLPLSLFRLSSLSLLLLTCGKYAPRSASHSMVTPVSSVYSLPLAPSVAAMAVSSRASERKRERN